MIKEYEMSELSAHACAFKLFNRKYLLSIMVFLLSTTVSSPSIASTEGMEACLLKTIKNTRNDQTIGEIRKACSDPLIENKNNHSLTNSPGNVKSNQTLSNKGTDKPALDPIARRIELEQKTELNPFVLTPHKPNYVLPFANNFDPNEEPFREELDGEDLDNTEVKFQVSLKFPVWKGLYKGKGDLYIAYTNLSFWQAYNSKVSSPFRETNHEPEIFFSFKNHWEWFGIKNDVINIGFVHQSNGQSGSLSRSWDRVYANFIFQKDNFAVSIKPWFRIPEDDGEDQNPNIEKYLGYGELRVGYKWKQHTLSSMFRNNFRSDNKGAMELGWSFPITNRVRGYVQYFYGYGESLIDYDVSVNRLSVGLALTDWM